MKHKNNKPTFYDFTKQDKEDELLDLVYSLQDQIQELRLLQDTAGNA